MHKQMLHTEAISGVREFYLIYPVNIYINKTQSEIFLGGIKCMYTKCCGGFDMKKLLVYLLTFVMVLPIICAPALAMEDEGIIEPEPIEWQLQIAYDVSEEFGDYMYEYPIVGEWYCMLYESGNSGYMYEPEGIFTDYLTINEDGTAVIHSENGETEHIVKFEVDDYLFMNLYDMEGNFMISFQVLNDEAVSGYTSTPVLIMYTNAGFFFFYNSESYDYFEPAVELAPVVTEDVLNAIDDIGGVSDRWELAYGMAGGRKICYGDLPTYRTYAGMPLDFEYSEEEGICNLHLDGFDKWFGDQYYFNPLYFEYVDEYGAIYTTNNNYDGYGEDTAVFRLHEDGVLSMEYFGATYVFSVVELDPLTEYSDVYTIKEVQTALNEQGYECGTPDGIAGKNTQAAISAFQKDNGLTETGTITYEMLDVLDDMGYDYIIW